MQPWIEGLRPISGWLAVRSHECLRAAIGDSSMEPRFTRGEYWLLETVIRQGCPFVYIHGPEVSQALNKPAHGLDRASLVDSLDRLFQTGLLGAAMLREGGCSGPFSRSLSRAEIEAALEETRDDYEARGSAYDETYYGLTPEGGRQWELFAAPDWERYVQYYDGPSRSERWMNGIIISPDLAQVERLFEGVRYMGHAIDPEHVHRRVLSPWQATYWKQLTHAHLISYRFRRGRIELGKCSPLVHATH